MECAFQIRVIHDLTRLFIAQCNDGRASRSVGDDVVEGFAPTVGITDGVDGFRGETGHDVCCFACQNSAPLGHWFGVEHKGVGRF